MGISTAAEGHLHKSDVGKGLRKNMLTYAPVLMPSKDWCQLIRVICVQAALGISSVSSYDTS